MSHPARSDGVRVSSIVPIFSFWATSFSAVALLCCAVLALIGAPIASAQVTTLDLTGVDPAVAPLTRVYGPDSDNGNSFDLGGLGVPVSAGADCNGDGFMDYGVGHFRRSPLGRVQAGVASLIFGNGTIGGTIDLQQQPPQVLEIYGAALQNEQEMAGSEVWIDDVTGDGLGDFLICRQNFSLAGRAGAGALTILVGDPALTALAAAGTPIDLANPPPGVTLLTLIGAQESGRLGIWVRTGDVTGDGIIDIAVGADREGAVGMDEGAVYVIRGGSHLASNITIDLASFGSTPLAGNVAKIIPPDGSINYHFGGTCTIGDLDGDNRAEVIGSATLNRAGASVGPFGSSQGCGGAPDGHVFIVWGDVFPQGNWPPGFLIDLETLPATDQTDIEGGMFNISFGEELLAGLDYTGDGNAELFVGDLVGDFTGGFQTTSGIGYIFDQAALLRGLSFNIDTPPPGIFVTVIQGPGQGAIGSDTVGHGDFNGDGIADLMVGNPGADPLGRDKAGTITVLLGQVGPFPPFIDTAPGVITPGVQIFELLGVNGRVGTDQGDTLCYSAAVGDIDADGRIDMVVNEMRGNGVSVDAIDSGNLLIISGALVPGGIGAEFVRGDANVDGTFDVADPIRSFEVLFAAGFSPCLRALDANDDGAVDLADPIYSLAFLFSAGPAPTAPYPGCGGDPTADLLSCGSFGICP